MAKCGHHQDIERSEHDFEKPWESPVDSLYQIIRFYSLKALDYQLISYAIEIYANN